MTEPDGDDSRRFLPFELNGESTAYMTMDSDKCGIALNLKDPDALDVLRKLQACARQKVDTSLFDAAVVQTYSQSAIAFAAGEKPDSIGSEHPDNASFQSFRTSDGWINVGSASQRNWPRFLDVIDALELDAQARFSSNLEQEQNLPAGPVNGILQMHEDPQVKAPDKVVAVGHAGAGTVRTPAKFSRNLNMAAHSRKPFSPTPLRTHHKRNIDHEVYARTRPEPNCQLSRVA